MAHYGLLRNYRFADDVDDIRGAALYGPDDEKIGKIEDVIFDHNSGTIQYAIVDAGGWLSSKKFLVPADRIHPRSGHEDDFATDMTKDAIKSLPEYDEKHVEGDKDWESYDKNYREKLETGPVLHKEDSTHIITPDPDEMPAPTGSGTDDEAYTPNRMAGVFTDTAPDPSKIRLRPQGPAGRAEDTAAPGAYVGQDIPTRVEEEALNRRQPTSAGTGPSNRTTTDAVNTTPVQQQRDTLTDPDDVYVSEGARHHRWTAFEDNLRRNRVDITAKCGSCATAKDKVA